MVKADVAQAQQRSRVLLRPDGSLPAPSGRWDWLAVLLLALASFPTVWLAPQTVTIFPNLGLIDDNWHLDSPFKALRGIWIGRDVAFTHGPIFQWLSSIPGRFLPHTFGALYATWNTIPIWCAFVFVFITLRLILPEQPAWKRFVLILLIAAFWETSLRSTYPVLLFAVFLRGWYAVCEGRARSLYFGISGALLCTLGFLIAGDVGIYSTAAWFICCIAIAVEMRREGFGFKMLAALASFAVAGLVMVTAVNRLMATPLDFRFWRDSLAQVAAYRWATPAAMTNEGTRHLVVALLICGTIFLLRTLKRTGDALQLTQRTGFLLGGFVFGLAVLQSALVRSDIGHVIIGEFALIFLTCVILFSYQGWGTTSGVLVAIAASMLFSHPIFRPSSVIRLYGQVRHPMTACPPSYSEFDGACWVEPLTPVELRAGGSFLSQQTQPNDSVFVFPYQTMFGLAAHRNVAGGLMQAYTASGPNLAKLEISGLEGKSIPAAIYLADPDYRHMSQPEIARWSRNYLSVPVDGIPNFTRAPEVWFWMLRHYHAAGQLSPGIVGLLRDDARASSIAFQAQPLGLPLRTYAVDDRESTTGLGTPNWPANSDFIRLRITAHYPIWWKLRKPERLQLEITHADGRRDVQWFIVQPNVSSEAWFYPWDNSELARYFDSDPNQWRLPARSPVVRLQVIATPLDWVSQQPGSITIESADAVTLATRPEK